MKKLVTIAVVVMAFAYLCLILYCHNKTLRAENDRLTANQTTLFEKATYYETEAGKSAASIQKLELSYSELEDNYKQVCQTADELGVKVKRLQTATTTTTETEVKIITQVHDSVVYHDGVTDSIKAVKWGDAWVNILGELRDDRLSLNVVSRDTLIQIVHRIPKKFLFFRWGTKAIRQEITSTNPHTVITHTEYIELK